MKLYIISYDDDNNNDDHDDDHDMKMFLMLTIMI